VAAAREQLAAPGGLDDFSRALAVTHARAVEGRPLGVLSNTFRDAALEARYVARTRGVLRRLTVLALVAFVGLAYLTFLSAALAPTAALVGALPLAMMLSILLVSLTSATAAALYFFGSDGGGGGGGSADSGGACGASVRALLPVEMHECAAMLVITAFFVLLNVKMLPALGPAADLQTSLSCVDLALLLALALLEVRALPALLLAVLLYVLYGALLGVASATAGNVASIGGQLTAELVIPAAGVLIAARAAALRERARRTSYLVHLVAHR
jgi:hypothetical protein